MNAEQDPIELSRRLVYLAAERTLSAWIRTALSLMALGFVIDRFDLILRHLADGSAAHAPPYPHFLSTWGGSALVGMGVLMALAAGIRYLRFALGFRRDARTDVGSSLVVGAVFALVLAAFGLVLIAALTLLLS